MIREYGKEKEESNMLFIPGNFDDISRDGEVCSKIFGSGWMTSDFRGQMRLKVHEARRELLG